MLRLGANGGSFPRPLSAAEEQHYVNLYLQGDMEARNVLIEHNLRLVAHIIKKYYTQTDDQDDLISIGTIGLIKGISTYKPDKGVRLATYASRCIENAILSRRNEGFVVSLCLCVVIQCFLGCILIRAKEIKMNTFAVPDYFLHQRPEVSAFFLDGDAIQRCIEF